MNHRSVMFCQESLNHVRRMGKNIVVMQLPIFAAHRFYCLWHTAFMKVMQDLPLILFSNILALCCVFMMHHPMGVKENGQHDSHFDVHLPCFLCLGNDLCFHCNDKVWFPVQMTMFMKSVSLFAHSNMAFETSICSCFYSIVSVCHNFADTFCMPKSVKMECTEPVVIPTSSTNS